MNRVVKGNSCGGGGGGGESSAAGARGNAVDVTLDDVDTQDWWFLRVLGFRQKCSPLEFVEAMGRGAKEGCRDGGSVRCDSEGGGRSDPKRRHLTRSHTTGYDTEGTGPGPRSRY